MRIVPVLAAVALAACSPVKEEAAVDGDLRIAVKAHRAAPWRATYELKTPLRSLDLGPSIESYRAAHWRVDGARLISRDGRDFIEPLTGELRSFAVEIDPASIDLRKDYAPFTAMGDGGVLFYSGHIIPWQDRSVRLDASLTIVADEGDAISAFGETRTQFQDWRSPFDHPAFLYIGAGKPVETPALLALTDATAPDWIRREIETLAPALSEALQEILARALPTKPNLFVVMGDQSEAGRLNYKGDALPGQYQMTLVGGGWNTRSPEALSVLRRSTAHEAAHLWQAAVRPKSASVPNWIHEGGAEALAAEAMVAAGYWTVADRTANFTEAREECAASLERLSLQRAEAEQRWEAVYACGHVLTVAAAGKRGVGAFWREFAKAAAKDGYDEALFLALAEARVGKETADAMRRLIRINEARPEKTIAAMLALDAARDD